MPIAFEATTEPSAVAVTAPRVAPPAEPATPVDTTGAGDAFNGALAAALAQRPGAAFAVHLREANRYAALSTERAGAALSMPTREDLDARFPD